MVPVMRINLDKNPIKGRIALLTGLVIFWPIMYYADWWVILSVQPIVIGWAYITTCWMVGKPGSSNDNSE